MRDHDISCECADCITEYKDRVYSQGLSKEEIDEDLLAAGRDENCEGG